MVFNTISVGTAVTPKVIETYFSHYLNRKPLREKPTAHISYHEGVNLIREFLNYASHHTVEDIQGFTSQWVPSPRWVKVDEVDIPEKFISEAAKALAAQLGHRGIDKVGGEQWWQWRRDGSKLQAEWIEMRRDYTKRKASGEKGKRVMLYVHGGAYFFGSVDEHRYQLQRHARKLEARVLARKCYIPMPHFTSATNAVTWSAIPAGTAISISMRILVLLRDRNLPLPAGAILISPWVDLTHSFPSVAGDGSSDYIPTHGFHQRPSASWPPPNTDDMEQIAMHAVEQVAREALPRRSSQAQRREAREEAIQGFSVDHTPSNLYPRENADNPFGTEGAGERPGNTIPGPGHDLSILIDGKFIEIKDQIHMYTTNQLISHPLVSPVLQPSLGGLPPLLVVTGGGEVLRDEQIYLAHKAADPAKYPPGDAYLDEYPEARDIIAKWHPTNVQLQVWDDLCHVAPTLSFTRPAKYMYRSIAQFGAWALARAQKTGIEIMYDDDMSIISSRTDTKSEENLKKPKQTKTTKSNGVVQGGTVEHDQIGRAGDPLPVFKDHMIRQRIDRHGNAFPLDPPSSLPALEMSSNEIGVIKPEPVQKWMEAKKQWDTKYAREKRKVQKQRAKEMAKGYQSFGNDEVPPPSALAGRRGLIMPKEEKKSRSWGMSLWSLWGSSHDEDTITREEKADKEPANSAMTETDGTSGRPTGPDKTLNHSISRSRRRTVTDAGQTNHEQNPVSGEKASHTADAGNGKEKPATNGRSTSTHPNHLAVPTVTSDPPSPADDHPANKDTSTKTSISKRPTAGGVAYPFKLSSHLTETSRNASTVTLQSQAGIVSPKVEEEVKHLGENTNTTTGEAPESSAESVSESVPQSGNEEWRQRPQDEKMRRLGEDDDGAPGSVDGRRGTLEDAKGVLHYGFVDSRDKGNGSAADGKRPVVDRVDTANPD
ncbi:hypothetical protein N7G274_002472 [Stereocaulon virgatum]|uniref:Alpha/beta hydrolase fold-3 domain-containing protein n=1 Tax=Stereocaulon virgatum TaxID=373712 RepID=A0ABR4AFX8_9LECA